MFPIKNHAYFANQCMEALEAYLWDNAKQSTFKKLKKKKKVSKFKNL